MMATRPLPEPVEIEYVPDEDEATAAPPQVLRPALIARREPPSDPARVSRFLPEPSPAVSPSMRALLTMAATVVILVSFLAMVVHSRIPATARVTHPAVAPGAMPLAKPSAYGEAFSPTTPARKPRTRHAVATTPPPDDSSESAVQ